jgi:hypothetical protein
VESFSILLESQRSPFVRWEAGNGTRIARWYANEGKQYMLILLILLLLIFGGGGGYYGYSHWGVGGGGGILLVVILLLFFVGRGRI